MWSMWNRLRRELAMSIWNKNYRRGGSLLVIIGLSLAISELIWGKPRQYPRCTLSWYSYRDSVKVADFYNGINARESCEEAVEGLRRNKVYSTDTQLKCECP